MLPTPAEEVDEAADNATRLRRRTARRRSTGAALLTLVLLLAVLAGAAGWWFGSGPGSLIAVPAVAGLDYERAAATVTAEGLVPERAEQSSIDVEAGLVIESAPGEGERVEKDSTVQLIVSTGPARHELPALHGRSADEVRAVLAENRVNVSDDVEEYFDDLDAGLVLNVRITPRDQREPYACGDGCEVFEDDTALIQLSLGAVPDVTGKSVDEAVRALEEARLQVSDERPEDWSDSVAKGSVIAQSAERPGGGAWRPGDTVTLTVSKGPQPLPIPDVKGKTVRQAVDSLKDAGFKVNPTIEDMELPLGGKYWDVYKVCSYDPSGSAARGTTVTLTPGFFC